LIAVVFAHFHQNKTERKIISVFSDEPRAIEGQFVSKEAVTEGNQALEDPREVDNATSTRFEGKGLSC
jgi:hypothetical protein